MIRTDHCPSEDRLHLHAAGGLTATEAATLAAHVDGCADCRRRLDALRTLLALLPDDAQLPTAVETARFSARVVAASRPSGQRFYLWGSAATALVAGLLAVFLFRPGSLPQPGSDVELTAPAELTVLQDLDLIENLDLLEDLDLLEQLENNG